MHLGQHVKYQELVALKDVSQMGCEYLKGILALDQVNMKEMLLNQRLQPIGSHIPNCCFHNADSPEARSAMVANPHCCIVLLAMVSCSARPALRYWLSPVMEWSRYVLSMSSGRRG